VIEIAEALFFALALPDPLKHLAQLLRLMPVLLLGLFVGRKLSHQITLKRTAFNFLWLWRLSPVWHLHRSKET
jgi:hypothetical protein